MGTRSCLLCSCVQVVFCSWWSNSGVFVPVLQKFDVFFEGPAQIYASDKTFPLRVCGRYGECLGERSPQNCVSPSICLLSFQSIKERWLKKGQTPDMGQIYWGKGAGADISLGVYAFPSHLHATELIAFLEAVDRFLYLRGYQQKKWADEGGKEGRTSGSINTKNGGQWAQKHVSSFVFGAEFSGGFWYLFCHRLVWHNFSLIGTVTISSYEAVVVNSTLICITRMGHRCHLFTDVIRSIAPKGKSERSQSKETQQSRQRKYLKISRAGLIMETRALIMR